jgi:DHA1 family bicyclomycin/chloramphenicol resistance-like MFS transporter
LIRRYQQHVLPFREFIALMALMMSLVALSIDAVLPALESIGSSFGVTNANDNQLLIGSLFIGMAFGQLLFGPLSDSIGRRRSMTIGFLVFFVGSLMALFADNFETMLISRLFQGLGVAAPRAVSTAIVRDLYEGRAMARVMSFIMMIFILVPMLAPAFGQIILTVANWQAIFVVIALIGLVSLVWYLLRQGETLAEENQADFTVTRTLHALRVIFTNRAAYGYTIAAGIISGPFIFYLSSAQQLFQNTYELGQWFPLYFAGLAFAFGMSSFVNGKQVMKFGMHRIVKFALNLMTVSSFLFIFIAWWFNGLPDLWITTIYMLLTFFCIGLIFGNLNALAMQPLGHIAGIGAAVVGSLSTFISVIMAFIIGQQFDGTVHPQVISFSVSGVTTLVLMWWIEDKKGKPIIP